VTASGDHGLKLDGFIVGGFEFEGPVYFALGTGEVTLPEEGHGEIVVIVGIVGIGCRGALEEGDSVAALTARSDGLIVYDLRKREATGDEGEGRLGLGIIGRVEAGKPEVEAGLKSAAVRVRNFGKSGCGLIEVSLSILGLPECE
jgi:hypothetical protein